MKNLKEFKAVIEVSYWIDESAIEDSADPALFIKTDIEEMVLNETLAVTHVDVKSWRAV